MKINLQTSGILVLLMLFLCSNPELQAATKSVGTLQLEKGIIRLRRNEADTIHKEAGKVLPVFNGDEFQTGLNTFVRIKLVGSGDDIELSSQTFFRFTNISTAGQELSMPVGKGIFNVAKPKIQGRKRRFRIKTANAMVNIKGSRVITASFNGETSILTLSGLATLSSLEEPEIQVEVKINQASQLKVDSRPTVPILVPPEVRDKILTSDTPQVFKTVVFGKEISIKIVKQKEKKKEEEKDEKKEDKKDGDKKEEKQDQQQEQKDEKESDSDNEGSQGDKGGDDEDNDDASGSIDDDGTGDDELSADQDVDLDNENDLDDSLSDLDDILEETEETVDEATQAATDATIRLKIINP